MRRLILIPAIALLALAAVAAFWGVSRGGDDGAEADVREGRWGKVTLSVPEDSGVIVQREFEGPEINPPDGGPVLVVFKEGSFPESLVLVDAETGETLLDTVRDADRATVDNVLTSLEVSEFDAKTGPWPYGDTPPNVARDGFGRLTFIPPDPASGLTVRGSVNDPGGYAIQITNGRSTLSIDAETGDVFEETTIIAREDEEAFNRFLSTIEYLGPAP